MIRSLFYSLPVGMRFWARRLYYLPLDILSPIQGMPPRGLIYTGGGDFKETGERFVQYFIQYGGLKASDDVMDIGSGIGRMAIPLSNYLDSSSRYYGFDLVKTGVDWCQKNISTKYPNFDFRYVDLDNDLYTHSVQKADQFIFPYENESVDFVFLISVFTHMIPQEMNHYLSEIYRCLKPGGKCFFSCFIYDDVDRLSKNPKFSFKYVYNHHALMNQKVSSANVAFSKTWLYEQIENRQFNIKSEHEGSWADGNDKALDFQDIIILEK